MTEPEDVNDRPERPTKIVTIGGLEVTARFISEAQAMQIAHELSLFQSPKIAQDRKVKGLGRIYRVLNSVIVDEEEREAVEDLISDGVVDAYDLVGVLKSLVALGGTNSTQKVRRGRPAQRR